MYDKSTSGGEKDMTKTKRGGVLAKVSIAISLLVVLWGSSPTVSAQEIVLNLEDAPLLVSRGASKTKRLVGIPNNSPGYLSLKVKWHAKALIPNTFNKLTVVLLHGSRILETSECYSQHADKTPKCHLSTTISQTEANTEGDWKLRVTNHSNENVDGFNIVKESSDLNPFVPNIKSTFQPDCSTRYLLMYPEVSIGPRSTVEKVFSGLTNIAGELQIKAKWHTDALTPNLFDKLTVEVLRDGIVVASDEGYSIHSGQKGKTDKIDLRINVGSNQANGWSLRIRNKDYSYIKGFALEKGNDLNPFVPAFRSVFIPCR